MAMMQPYQANQASNQTNQVNQSNNTATQQASATQTVQSLPEPQRVNPPNLGQKVDFFA